MVRFALAAALTTAAALTAAAPAAHAQDVPCPGAQPACPWTAASQVGQRDGGVLRFPQAIAVAPDGTVYVGDQGSRTVQAFGPDGRWLRSLGQAGTRAGELSGVGALAVAGDGTVLVADGQNKLVRFTPDGRLVRSWGKAGSDVGEFLFGGGRGNDAGAGGGLAVANGIVYVADSGNDRIQRFDLDGGRGTVIVPPGQLGYPKGLAVRGSRLFVADNQNHRVLVKDTGGRTLREIRTGAGSGGAMQHPYGVTTDPQGRVYVSDNLGQRVLRFSTGPTYPYKGRWGSYGTRPGQLAYPRAIATNAAGEVLVTNTGNDRVDVFDRGGALVRSFGTSGRAPGQFGTPLGVAADASGMRAVTDSVNGRVQVLAPDGSVLAVWGSPNPGPTILPRPVAVAFDGAGNAYVLDQRRARIVVFSRTTGQPVRTIGAQGSGPGKLLDPSALAIDADGTLFVADTGNRRIAQFAADGAYLGAITGAGAVRGIAVTPAGDRIYTADSANRIVVRGGDGAQVAQFGGTGNKLGKLNAPGQMTVDAAGTLWVADRGNSRVQRFGPDGERLLAVGERGTGPGQFLHPTGISVDCRGTLTVTDSSNNRVQQFALAAPPAATCTPVPAPATPPAPKLPTLPPPDGPAVSLDVVRRSGLLGRGLPIRVGCDTGCDLTLTATLTPRATPKKGRRTSVTLAAVRAALPAGDTKLLRVRPTPAQVRRLRKALRGRKGLVATLSVTAVPAAGETTSLTQRVEAGA
ncbi:NHL repeat-containing protein [Conexibacter sp. SYSU D00693]|uniref:NHL repeat-containing protein n=1 Tax=Conexibacter sp. SYSU D00693 TaxID=2812560 RepID=UPI00196AA6DA|nr:NHL repeat-containing protein [Conexibacter sp. SYSU D00693]